MKQNLLNLKSWLLMMCLLVGVGSAWAETYEKVTTAPADWTGEYVVTVQNGEELLAWTGIDAGQCRETVTLTDGKIVSSSLITITVEALTDGGYSVKVNGGGNDGKYISSGTAAPTYSNGLKFVSSPSRVDFAMNTQGCVTMTQTISGNSDASKNGTMYFLYNKNTGSNNERFRFYKSTNYGNDSYLTPILYKKSESAETVHVTGVSLNKITASVNVGETTTLTATVTPTNASNSNVTWSSDKESVATVKNGVVTGVSAGTANITVKTVDGDFTATCAVTVNAVPVTGISLDKESLELMVGNSATLVATIAPENAANKSVVWVSNDDNVAKVDDNGKVTAVAVGETTITAISEDGEYEATCNVKVVENPIIYKWDGTGSTTAATQEGGVASVPIESSTNMVAGSSQKGNFAFKINKGVSSTGGPFVILITLDRALKAGDVITGAVFRTSETTATLGVDFLAADASASAEYTVVDPQVLSSNGTPSDNISFVVPKSAEGKSVIRIYRQTGSTGLYVSKLVVTRPATKGTIDIVAKGLMPGYSDIAPELDFYFATFSSDKDVIIEGGHDVDLFGVYTVSVDPEEGVVSVVDPEDISMAEVTDEEIMAEDGFVTGYYVPANTGVLVISMGNQATYYYVAESESNYLAEIDPDGTNMLQPASKDKAKLPNHKFYKLAYSDSSHAPETLGFYWGAENGGAFTSKAGLAYLAVPTGEGNESLAPKGFRFVDSDATAIKSVENKGKINVVYNLAGQRVSTKSFKGIVIKNGKKILNK